MNTLSHIRYEMDVIDHIQLRMTQLYTSLFGLQNNADTIFDYLRVLASHSINPMVIPPEILRQMLKEVQVQIAPHPRLQLFEDIDKNIWVYYENIKIVPVVMNDFLMIILDIPLVNKSLEMNLYKVHNLPILHPDLKVEMTYELEGKYFATLMQGMYMTIPDETNIKICQMTQGQICMFDQAMYPIDTMEWCIYALFVNDLDQIKKLCRLVVKPRNADLAYSLDGYMWAISSLAASRLQIHCLLENKVVNIKPPLQIIDIGNGCEGYSPNIYIPAKTELTTTVSLPECTNFLLYFNFKYVNLSSFLVWYNYSFHKLMPEEKAKLQKKIVHLPPLPMHEFEKELQLLDPKYSLKIPPSAILTFQVVVGFVVILTTVIMVWLCLRHCGHLSTLLKFAPEVPKVLKGDFTSIGKLLHPATP